MIMNPVCKIDVNSIECQNWMSDVYNQCRELFANESVDPFAAWWHDESPAVYKSNVQTMTAYDCHKLKRELGREVAELIPNAAPTEENPLSLGKFFLWWHKLLLILVYVGIIILICLMCRWLLFGGVRAKAVEEQDVPVEEEKPTFPLETNPKKKRTVKGWARHRCRPIFVHSEATLQRQKSKRQQEDRAHAVHTQRKIKKWTVDREQAKEEAKQRQIAREEANNNV